VVKPRTAAGLEETVAAGKDRHARISICMHRLESAGGSVLLYYTGYDLVPIRIGL
jgi:hypothetical protein